MTPTPVCVHKYKKHTNKTWAFCITNSSKDEPNSVLQKFVADITTWKFDNIEQQENPLRSVQKGKHMCSGRVGSSVPLVVKVGMKYISLVEQELLAILEFTPGFWCGSCYYICSLMCMFCRSLIVFLYFFLLALVLSVFSSIYGLWLSLWYRQTLLSSIHVYVCNTVSVL